MDVDLTRAYQALNLDAEATEACGHAVETLRRLDLPFELATALMLRGQIAERRSDWCGSARPGRVALTVRARREHRLGDDRAVGRACG